MLRFFVQIALERHPETGGERCSDFLMSYGIFSKKTKPLVVNIISKIK